MKDLNASQDTLEIGIEAPVGGSSKRLFDVVFSTVAVLSVLPLFLVISCVIRFVSPGPVLFVHERVGFDGKKFGCLKFRTMVVDAEKRLDAILSINQVAREEFARDHKLKDDPRIIPVIGNFLRSSSLDELPQFLNVLRGDMSVVGPRPVTVTEIIKYGTFQPSYLSVRPGITGLWQVSGRNEKSFAERVVIDTRYVETWSMLQDIKIIWRTFEVISNRKGAY